MRSAGRQQLHALFGKRLCQLDDAGLVRDGKQRGADFHAVRGGDFFGSNSHRSLLKELATEGREGDGSRLAQLAQRRNAYSLRLSIQRISRSP
ncbi:hypothetical protein D3C80_432190 [compost metagenome]